MLLPEGILNVTFKKITTKIHFLITVLQKIVLQKNLVNSIFTMFILYTYGRILKQILVGVQLELNFAS